jgi:hypothetical protein
MQVKASSKHGSTFLGGNLEMILPKRPVSLAAMSGALNGSFWATRNISSINDGI